MRELKAPYQQLFVAVLLQIGILEVSPDRWIQQPMNLVITVWIALLASTMTGSRREAVVLLVLGWTPALLDLAVAYEVASLGLNITKALFWIAFPFYLAKTLLRRLFSARDVSHHELYGAIALYMLLGLGFANLHAILFEIDSGSLIFTNLPEGQVAGFSDFLYFSFVTLGTLGYGDVAPVTRGARLAAMFEALVGLMYVAVVVGRVVALHTARSQATFDRTIGNSVAIEEPADTASEGFISSSTPAEGQVAE